MALVKETKTAEPACFMKGTNKLRKLLTLTLLTLVLALIITTETTYAAKVKDLTVKTTGTMLLEGQKITQSTVKKAVTVKAKYTDGTTKTYTGYKVKEANKTVKAITSGTNKGKCKLTLTAGSVKKVIYVKVNKLKKIYIKKLKTSL